MSSRGEVEAEPCPPQQRPSWPHLSGKACDLRGWQVTESSSNGTLELCSTNAQRTLRQGNHTGASRTGLCGTAAATRRQTRLEGLVAKSATEWGSTFGQEESFWLLNLKIWYLWNEPFHKLCWKKKYLDFFLNGFLVLKRTQWSWGEGEEERRGTHLRIFCKLNKTKSDSGIILRGYLL